MTSSYNCIENGVDATTAGGVECTQTTSVVEPMLPPCRVCSEKASGFHYGANTCEACKVGLPRDTFTLEVPRCLYDSRPTSGHIHFRSPTVLIRLFFVRCVCYILGRGYCYDAATCQI